MKAFGVQRGHDFSLGEFTFDVNLADALFNLAEIFDSIYRFERFFQIVFTRSTADVNAAEVKFLNHVGLVFFLVGEGWMLGCP